MVKRQKVDKSTSQMLNFTAKIRTPQLETSIKSPLKSQRQTYLILLSLLVELQNKKMDRTWTPSLYLVLAEGSLDQTGGLIQLSLLWIWQSQLSQVSLHLAVGGIDELTPVS